MKKSIVFIMMLFLGILSTVSAKDFKDDRWQWFYSDANYTGKVDLQTLSYNPAQDVAEVWAVWIIPAEGFQELRSYKVNFKKNKLDTKEEYLYRKGSDKIVGQRTIDTSKIPVPGSGDEALMIAVKGLVGRDAKLAEYKKKKN